jgi:hypothetical protein
MMNDIVDVSEYFKNVCTYKDVSLLLDWEIRCLLKHVISHDKYEKDNFTELVSGIIQFKQFSNKQRNILDKHAFQNMYLIDIK